MYVLKIILIIIPVLFIILYSIFIEYKEVDNKEVYFFYNQINFVHKQIYPGIASFKYLILISLFKIYS